MLILERKSVILSSAEKKLFSPKNGNCLVFFLQQFVANMRKVLKIVLIISFTYRKY